MPLNTSPAYNLKAVLQQTGLKADVLRAWERRYGLPAPKRTPGGHRLYSEQDIALTKWLLARQKDGLSISHAVELWRKLINQGHNPHEILSAAPEISAPLKTIYLPPETGIEGLRARWITACLNYDEKTAEQILNQAFSMYPLETVCAHLLASGMNEIGMLWYQNHASVQQEHFASGLVLRRLNALISAAPVPIRTATIIIGCPPQEQHTFTSLLLTLFLRRRGINVIYLGADVPNARLEETLAAIQPHLVVLSGQQLITAATLQQSALTLTARGAKTAFGGRIFSLNPSLKTRIPGFYLGDSFDSALTTIDSLLIEPRDPPQILPAPPNYQAAQRAFLVQRPLIENVINQHLAAATGPASPQYFATAHQFMGNNILAALQLGDIHYLDNEMDWLQSLLKANHLPAQTLNDYLTAYTAAAEQLLGPAGQPVLEWLNLTRR